MPTREPIRDLRRLAKGWRWRLEHVLGTPVPADYEPELAVIVKRVRRETLTGAARIAALCDAVAYLVEAGVEGDLVECGVWRGGSMMAAALTLIRLGETERDLYLFDTFTGMPEPGDGDERSAYDGYSMHRKWRRKREAGWAAVSEQIVRRNLESTGYPPERIHLVAGMVEQTLPARAPESLALLRLDTDWYASTKHELEQLYPRLSAGGALIVDDYGHYAGARRAVDEFLAEAGESLLLSRIDYTGRIAIRGTRAGAAKVAG
ncbi:MAG: TylF/MycF/NovP-related O-methyltransferase [Solirubrobacterales bacterium]